jgi:hypothetical protein
MSLGSVSFNGREVASDDRGQSGRSSRSSDKSARSRALM